MDEVHPRPGAWGFSRTHTTRERGGEGAGKGAVLNARILWTFSAAHGLIPIRTTWLMAERAYTLYPGPFPGQGIRRCLLGTGCKGEVSFVPQADLCHGLHHLCPGRIPHGLRRSKKALELAIAFSRTSKNMPSTGKQGLHRGPDPGWEALEDLRLSEKDENEAFHHEYPPPYPGGLWQPVQHLEGSRTGQQPSTS